MLNEFEHQYNDIWFNNMLNMLTDRKLTIKYLDII